MIDFGFVLRYDEAKDSKYFEETRFIFYLMNNRLRKLDDDFYKPLRAVENRLVCLNQEGTMIQKPDQLSIQDIADALGVSKSTVSRVISGKGRIGSETRDRILKFIEENHYRPSAVAKGFSESKTYNIGVVLPMDKHLLEIPFFQACLLGVSMQITEKDYDVVVITVDENDISNLKRIVENKKVDGIILTRLMVEDKQIDYLKSVGIPFLVIGAPRQEGLTYIDSDNKGACAKMTSKLIECGYAKPGLLLGSKTYMVNNQRYEGFKEGFLSMKVPFDEASVHFDLNEKEEIDGAIDLLIEEGHDLIVCGDDYICTRVISYLEYKKQMGSEIIQVASFYNSQTLESLHAHVSVVDFDILAVGQAAGKAILELISKGFTESKLISNYKIILEAQNEK